MGSPPCLQCRALDVGRALLVRVLAEAEKSLRQIAASWRTLPPSPSSSLRHLQTLGCSRTVLQQLRPLQLLGNAFKFPELSSVQLDQQLSSLVTVLKLFGMKIQVDLLLACTWMRCTSTNHLNCMRISMMWWWSASALRMEAAAAAAAESNELARV